MEIYVYSLVLFLLVRVCVFMFRSVQMKTDASRWMMLVPFLCVTVVIIFELHASSYYIIFDI